ncbi:mitochondrial assembly of ribosomal large subunit protein 1 [Protopterus annectens]|uniref:mitochondrial assembly of ribosomal large subunit protein 1 n=1 Tax=Protopterus annectens TaxID=7888 RepID=UPI001CF9BCBB|nr:mitochondrial assembly of ribosomal large subunit protein 1 [Protopterus annectens]
MRSLLKPIQRLFSCGATVLSSLYRQRCVRKWMNTSFSSLSLNDSSFILSTRMCKPAVFLPVAVNHILFPTTYGPVSGSSNNLQVDEVKEQALESVDENAGTIPRHIFNIDLVVALLRQENAKDICVIKLPPEMTYTDYFVIASGTSTRHLQAMAHYTLKMYKYMKNPEERHVQIEGKDSDDWMCIDFGNIVVHFMLPETREVYELEKLWTLHSYDDQLAKITPETLPTDFMYELQTAQKE